MLGVTDLRKGTIFVQTGTPYKVLDYSQKVMGRGGSIVNVKVKSLRDSKILDKTFKGGEKLEPADIKHSNAQFLYADDKNLFFMDPESFEQFNIASSVIGEQKKYLKESQTVKIQLFEGSPVSVELPKNVDLEVIEAEDAVRGDTTSSVTKNAKLETGAIIRVPAFIKTGDVVSVDTASGAYRSRK